MTQETDTPSEFTLGETELNPNLVFAKFGELAKKRELLYIDFIEIDEPEEIGTTWVEFSGEVVQDLLEVVDLTKSLFERLIDEIRRSNQEPSKEELGRIKNLTSFWLDLSVISYLYATIEKRGVLDQKGKNAYSMGYVNTKKSLDELTLLAFQAGQEFFKLESRITLGEALSLNMEKKRLDFISDLGQSDDLRNEILGEYDKNQALFLMTRVFGRLLESSESWWFLDPIALHSASEHALSHIDSMRNHWSKCTSDLVEKANRYSQNQIPIATLSSKVALAQHYRRLAMSALESRANEIAANYFSQAAQLTSTLELENVTDLETIDIWDKSIPDQHLIYTQMMHLATISADYQQIITLLETNEISKVKELLPNVLDKLSTLLAEGDLPYISSVAVAYETIFAYISEQIQQGGELKNIIAFVKNRIKTVGARLHKASRQMVKNWMKVVRKDSSNITILEDLIANIDYPLMAILILPPQSEISSSKELTSIQMVTEALAVSTKAEEEFGKNPVKEMLMRAKTFELSQKALTEISQVTDSMTVSEVKSILEPVGRNAFLRGLIAEIQLRTAVLQYHYVNRIAPIIENSALNSFGAGKPALHDKEELEIFIDSLKELQLATHEVRSHRSPINIGGAPLNWDYIDKLYFYSSGLLKILQAINHAIAAASTSKKEIEDAVTNWDAAKTLTFEAADIIVKEGSQEAEGISQQVYTLAQILYEYENKKRERREVNQFPVDGIVELVSTLLMGL